MEAVGTARLTSDILAQRAVGASVSRRQITDVLQEPDGDPELVLDLAAAEGDERVTISMTWSRDDLERLLEAASGDEVGLVFDRDELANALSDVEAHGVRTRAAIFAVAAAGALGSGATIANAAVEGVGSGTAATPVAAVSADESAALEARSQALNEQYGLGTAGEAAALEARSQALNEQYGLGSADNEAAALEARSQALNEQYGLGTAGDEAEAAALEARSQALNEQHGLGSAGNEAAAVEARSQALNEQYGLGSEAAALEARSQALNEQYGLGTAGEAAALEARSQALNEQYGLGTAREATESSGGLSLEAPTADQALLIGGLLLTIVGASFVVRRTPGARPA